MKPTTENEELLRDMLATETPLRESTLQAGLAALRHRRRWRAVRAAMVTVAPLLLLAAWLLRAKQLRHDLASHSTRGPIVAVTDVTVEGTRIRVLSDEDLLSFFPGRPVALVGSPGQQQLLLFDESRN